MTAAPPPFKRFELLSDDFFSRESNSATAAQHFPSADQELASYVSYLSTKQEIGSDISQDFWIKDSLHSDTNSIGLVAASGSQAYSKQFFSLCGNLSARKRNTVSVNLEGSLS